ncbi:hypothetical protein RDI58_006657 [Solanum bulbocastanum]|uniref:BHLH domain-containing protein n=1 Tax=Solanum bulbocastanum TaxID=147425 RepID=A0AAN8TUP4_SOLBU
MYFIYPSLPNSSLVACNRLDESYIDINFFKMWHLCQFMIYIYYLLIDLLTSLWFLLPFQGHPTSSKTVTIPHQPAIRPRFRARRGQATDPHSIAERLRRERISERIKALQELVPSCNKVLSMSRLGGASAVAQLVADIPLQSVEGDSCESRSNQHVWEKWSDSETEQEVAKLMEEDVGTAMQYLQSKSLCTMPVSLAALIYPTQQTDNQSMVKPEPTAPS